MEYKPVRVGGETGIEFYYCRGNKNDEYTNSNNPDGWYAFFYYPFKQPVLHRTCGYMTLDRVMKLPTKEQINQQLGIHSNM